MVIYESRPVNIGGKAMVANEEEILTLEEMMKYLKIGRNLALKILMEGKIKAAKIGNMWRIPKKNVDKFLNGEEE